MIRLRQMAAIGLAAFTLGSCTQEIMTSHIWLPSSDAYFTSAAAPGPVLAVVAGNPFSGVSKAALESTVIEAITNNHNGPRTQFVSQPGQAALSNERFVFAFNTPRSMDSYRLCGDTATLPSERQGNGRMRVLAGFCVGTRLFSEASVSIPVVASPNDPRFRHMLASAMWELVPTRDPFEEDDNDCNVRLCP